MEHVRQVYSKAATRFAWKRQDVVMLDNMAVVHGRDPFVGERSTLVIMAESSLTHLPAEHLLDVAIAQ